VLNIFHIINVAHSCAAYTFGENRDIMIFFKTLWKVRILIWQILN